MKKFNLFASLFAIGLAISTSFAAQAAVNPANASSHPLPAFSGVSVSGGFHVSVNPSAQYTVTLAGNERDLANIMLREENNVLHISYKQNYIHSNSPAPVIAITAPTLSRLSLAGDIKAQVNNVSAKSLEINIAGASTLNVQGSTAILRVNMAGQSTLNASKLAAHAVIVNAHGDNNITVQVNKGPLDVNAHGANKINYIGKPGKLTLNQAGANKVKQIQG